MSVPATKVCIDCKGRPKPLSAFYRVHRDSEQRQSRCKRCDNLRRTDGPRLEGPIKCPLCTRTFRRIVSLNGHMGAHRRPGKSVRAE